jgi:tetratricopeptide (TPR) repeat protein
MYQRALQGFEKAWGPEHTSTLDTVNNLGLLYADQGKLVEAEQMYQRALQGYEKALGLELIKTYIPAIKTSQNLAKLYNQQGRVSEAKEVYSSALHGLEMVYGPSSQRYHGVAAALEALRTDNGH